MFPKFFTLEEAKKALPTIKEFILAANQELEQLAEDLQEENERCHRLERRLINSSIVQVVRGGGGSADSEGEHELVDEEARQGFERAAEKLADLQENYFKRLNYWLDKIGEQGVILRDLRTGLLDFPAKQNEMVYFLCWRLTDADINFWHLPEDGFAGRRPLAVLIEYI